MWVLFIVPIFICIYLSILFSLIRIGELEDITLSDNTFLNMADSLSPFNIPELNAAIANYDRKRASLSEDLGERTRYLESAKLHWEYASATRPNWPYYQLGVFNAEINLGISDDQLGSRFDQIIWMAPNERGIDRAMLELGFAVWWKLADSQQDWLVNRMVSSGLPKTLVFGLEKANQYGIKPLVCSRLPWPLAKQHCL